MRNSRPIEITDKNKGPKRKLKLELIDGKRYIKKHDLKKYFFDDKWTIKDFNYHFGLGHRVVRDSLYRYFSKEEIQRSHIEKVAIKQRGSGNSNSCNWYIPGKLIPLREMQEAINNSVGIVDLRRKLKMTPFELSFIQQYYNLHLPDHNQFIEVFGKNLSKNQVILLMKYATMFGNIGDFLSDNHTLIGKAIENMVHNTYELRMINSKLIKFYRRRKGVQYNIPSNVVEYKFYKILIKLVKSVKCQYYIKALNIHVDFLVTTKTGKEFILEVDGSRHIEEKDIARDQLLNHLGYTVKRVDLLKTFGKRQPKYKDIRICLEKLISEL